MSEDVADRTFERWALAGAAVLAIAGLAAFQARRAPPPDEGTGQPAQDAGTDAGTSATTDGGSGDLVRVRIGGERPPEPPPDEQDGSRVLPDPAPPTPPPPPEPIALAQPRTVIVQPGETLGQIAQRELGTVRRLGEIVDLNGIEDPDSVRAGTELKLPPR